MAITMKRVCANVEKLYGMKLVAGSAGMEKFVRWVHIIEDHEVPRFLHGNELVFTTGIAHSGTDWLLEFIMKLQEKNSSGLVLNVGPYISSVPQNVISYCEETSFPLFTVPWPVHLIDITYDLCHRIVANEEIEMGLAGAFKNLIYSPDEVKSYKPTLERRGFYSESQYCVIAVKPEFLAKTDEDEVLNNLKFTANRILNGSGRLFCLFINEDMLVAVLNDFDAKAAGDFIKSLHAECEKFKNVCRVFIGASPTGKGYPFVSSAYNKAVCALKLAKMQNEPSLFYQNLGIYKLLVSVEDREVLHEYYQETLGRLEAADKKCGTDYVQTLRNYLENNSSVQAVAQKTYVHRNTINYKIKQIKKILKTDLGEKEKLKYLIAFYVSDLL